MNQNIINIIQVIFLNQNDKNGIKTHIILIQVLLDPRMEECRVQSLVKRNVIQILTHIIQTITILIFVFFFLGK